MKTFSEWFKETLPSDVALKAINNTLASGERERLNYQFKSFYDAINAGFVWSKSPEGFDYWNEIEKTYCKK